MGSLAEIISCLCAIVVIAFILFIILDRIIRIPRVGNYKDRNILVTGCDTGFGNLIAKRLDQLECHVFAGCLTEKGVTELKKVCSERLHAISMDVSSKESVRMALEYVKAKLPQDRGLWGILNNAGIFLNAGSPDWLTVDDFKEQCDVNLWGLIDVTLTFLPLVKKEKGRVVNVSTIGGRLCQTRFLPYSVSKYGVEAFTDGIRRTTYYFGCKASVIQAGKFLTAMAPAPKTTCAEIWKRASLEMKAEYGEDYVKYMIETELSDSALRVSDRLWLVVDAYEHALLARFPRERYLVGNDAKYISAPIQALPEWLGDWILRWLERGRPLPASLRR